MCLTPKQEAAAYSNGSVAVTAGAGTGKTHMLAERYLYHLRVHDFSPLEVVACTFTDKAAAELRSRIRSLVTKQLPDRTDLQAELEAAQISTIHALATRICRQHPLAAGVPPDFTVLDELEGGVWSTERIEEALDTLPAYLYEQIPYSLMSSAISTLIKNPIAAERSLNRGTEHWSHLATQLQQEALSQVLNHPVWQQSRLTLQTYAGKPGDRLEEEARQIALSAIAALEQGEKPKEPLTTISKLKINVGSQKNWPSGALETVKTAIKELRELVQKALEAGLVTLEMSSADEQMAAMLPALREAFQLVRDFLTQAKRRARILDFADLEVYALRAISDPEVQFYYRQRWKAFLVDEFQDTNPVQAELLECLISNTLLTIVGDAKQAIYGFRRADGSIFRAWCSRIQAAGGNEVVLDTSFRTHQTLVQDINRVFAPVLGTLHQDLEANRTESPHPSPHLQIYAIEAEKINKPQRLRAEGMHIAQVLKQMLDDQTLVHDKSTGSLRPIVAGDIAILSRTWSPLELYGEALASLGIPAALAGGGNLLATREAMDAWALLRFLADPADDLTLVAVLRSPFFAVSDRVLFTFAQGQRGEVGELRELGERGELGELREKKQSKIGWWQGLQSVDIPEVIRPVEVLGQLLRERAVEPPTRFLQLADRLTGYTAVIANLPGAARREADWRGFLELVRQLEQGSSDVFGVVRRLKRLAAGEVEVRRLPMEARDAVALMTIHAAKGLEWPVVVVPDLTRSMPNNAEPVYFDPELGVALKLKDEDGERQPVLYVCLEQMRKQREEAEVLRVLYVALTRARDRLILTATDLRGGGLERLQSGFNAAGIPVYPIPYDPESATPPIPPDPALLPEPPRLLLAPVASGLFELPVTALSEYACCPKRFQFRFIDGHPGMGKGTATAQRVGSLVHLALEGAIRDIDILAASDPGLERKFVEEAIALAQRFEQPDFAPFRQAIESREKPVTLSLGRLTFNGVVDLVGQDWVLDFKTDQEMSPQHHRFQLWAYAYALERQTAHIAYLRHDHLHTFSAANLETTGQEAQMLVQGILDGHYPAMPSYSNCHRCSYVDLCTEGYQGRDGDSGTQEQVTYPSSSPLESEVELLSLQIISQLNKAAEQYYRLIVIVVPPGGGQTINFRACAERIDSQYININLELSRRLLELTTRQRSLQVQRLLPEIIGNTNNRVVFLDNLEILFDVSLKLDPLRCLQGLARNRTVVAVWNGSFDNYLIYAEPEHSEYHRYPKSDLLVVNLNKGEGELSQ